MGKRKRARAESPANQKTAAGPDARRQLVFNDRFVQDLRYWVQADPRLAERLLKLVDLIARDPFHGMGKPEPLQGLRDTWSRRLTDEHRLTYRVADDHIDFLQGRFHYEK